MLVPDCPCNSPLPRKSPVKTVKSSPPRAMVNVCSGEINKFAVCSGKTKGGWRFSAYRTRQKRVDKARRRLRCLAGLGSISWGTTNLHGAVETDRCAAAGGEPCRLRQLFDVRHLVVQFVGLWVE